MRFAHMADCHLGAWSSHPDLKDMSLEAFEKAVDTCIAERVDFILIAGDLFDTSLPGIDILRRAVAKLRHCRDRGVPIYAIPGSHDFSPTGKTFLSVLENAGLLKDVAKWSENGSVTLIPTVDEKTGTKLFGLIGKRGALEKSYFEKLNPVKDRGFKILVFHSALEEYRPSNINISAVPISLLPKGLDYYASGHVHAVFHDEKNKVFFPGSLFPTDFEELEKYDSGFFIVDVNKDKKEITVKRKDIRLFDVVVMKIDADNKTASQIQSKIASEIEKSALKDKILLIKVKGCMDGRVSDIDFRSVIEKAREKGARIIKKSTSGLTTKEFEEIEVKNVGIEELEKELISRHAKDAKLAGAEQLTYALMNVLKQEKDEETTAGYEKRLKEDAKRVLGL